VDGRISEKNVYRTMELKGEGVMDGESGENEAGEVIMIMKK